MAHGVTEVLGDGTSVKMVHSKQQQHQSVQQQQQQQQTTTRKSVGVMGSRRIFAPAFKLKVLDSYRNDIDCRGNQRATARKYGIHRRQIQKWLQCEDNLRNSCAENTGNTSGSTGGSTTVLPSASVSKPDGTVTEATGPAVTPAAPALNLSLARLHGDELTTHQGPPPLLPHPPSHASAPPSPQYASQTSTTPAPATAPAPVMPIRVGYPEYHSAHHHHHHQQEEHHLQRELEERVQLPDVHGYPETRLIDQDRTYYLLNTESQRELESSPSSGYDTRNEVKVYQTLTSYRLPRPDHHHPRYGNETETSTATLHHNHHHHHRSTHEPCYADVDSSIDEKAYGLLLAPSMIKTERASPDSAATPGPCELASSPGASRVPLSPLSSSHQTIIISSSSSSNASVSSMSVHSDSPQTSASPCVHVHMHEHAHGSPASDSEKPIPSCLHHQERAVKEGTMQAREKGIEEETVADGEVVVKEELHLEEEETSVPRGIPAEGGGGGGEGGASSCADYQPAPAESSAGGSRPVSPTHVLEGYSLPSSPRGGPTSSERSSSSCSDSEMDPLDCSPGSQGSSNDLTRRRSFSLRFKLDVLDAFHRDVGVAGNQRATARKFGINRRQVQKWLGQETELRGEIALRGNSRQRLGPIQDAASGESPVDLRTTNYVSSLSHDRIEPEYERSPPPLYCCDTGTSSSSQHLPYYHHHHHHLHHHHQHPAAVDPAATAEAVDPVGPCNLSCCVDNQTAIASAPTCYQELSVRGTCYAEAQNRMYCYSPRDYPEVGSVPESTEETMSSPLKRHHCNLSCCYEAVSPSKRLCLEPEDAAGTNPCQDTPPQDTPLCLVKPKRPYDLEPVTSTVPTPPAPPTTKKDAILFKPYLDNPVSKPSKEHVIQRGLSPVTNQTAGLHNNNNNNNNNNCQSICNLNENRGHDYALELSLRLPVSWRTHSSPYAEFPQLRSAFVRYPASPHYT